MRPALSDVERAPDGVREVLDQLWPDLYSGGIKSAAENSARDKVGGNPRN